MLKLFTRTTPTDAKDTIKWVQIVKRPGTTAPIETLWEKKSGSYVTHAKHKKVMLIDKPSPSKLTVKLSTNEHVVVDAADCGPPFSANVKTTSDYNTVGRMSNLCHDCGCANILLPWIINVFAALLLKAKATARLSAKAAGKQRATASDKEVGAPPKKKGGRPVGSKDKVPRRPKTIKIAWNYGGRKAPPGMQFGAIGEPCTHDGLGSAFIVQQPSAGSLVLQFGEGNDATLSTVDAKDVQGIEGAAVVEGAASSSAAASTSTKSKTKRRPGATRKRSITPVAFAIQKRAMKAEVIELKKRKQREATAAAKGKPLKPAREKKNKSWDPALKKQAVDIYHTKYATSLNFAGCATELACLPSFEGITRGHIQGWVSAAAKLAAQEPNEFALAWLFTSRDVRQRCQSRFITN